MPWSPGPHAGFSDAPADRLIRPVVSARVETPVGAGERLADLLGERTGPPAGGPGFGLPPYGYRWFRVVGPGRKDR